MFWLFFPLYVTRLSCLLDWLERRDWVIVWIGGGHLFAMPKLERKDKIVIVGKRPTPPVEE